MSLKASLDTILSRRFGTNLDAPGVQVSIVKGGQIVYEGVIGLAKVDGNANDDDKEAVTTHHRSNLYSVTKFFTACSILKLIEDGKFQPNAKAKTLLPNFQNMNEFVPNDITVEHLVAHEGGAPNPLPLAWVHTPDDDAIDDIQCLTNILKKNSFRRRKPNTSSDPPSHPFQYSNVGYWLLGPIITNSCGAVNTSEFTSCCQKLLDLPKSISDKFDVTHPIAYGHVPFWSPIALAGYLFCPWKIIGPSTWKWIRMELHYIDGTAYGGLIGSSHDVSTWLGRLLQGEILSTSSLERLFQPVNSHMTFGLHIRDHEGRKVYHKEGGGAGCHSSIQIRPEQKLAGCVIAGDASFDVNGMLDELLDYIQEH